MPINEVELLYRAHKIWGACRGLGWTLDSERASKLIQAHLAEAVADANHRIEDLLRLFVVIAEETKQLKACVLQKNLEISELQRRREKQGEVRGTTNEESVPVQD